MFHGVWDKLTTFFNFAIALWFFFYILDIQSYFNFFIDAAQFRMITLCLLVLLTFLFYPMRKNRNLEVVPWYDFIFILITLIGFLYVVIFWPEIREQFTPPTKIQIILGSITILVVLESTRRVVGWSVPIIAIIFMIYALSSNYFPGLLNLPDHSYSRVVSHIYFGAGGLTGLIVNVIVTVVVIFVLFGALLVGAGGAKFFLDLSLSLAGRFSGGAAKVAVVASALFGTISGSPVANAAATGIITIPLMKSKGHPSQQAAAVEAVASTGGLIMPPVMGAAAFIMAEFLGTSYLKVCIAAFLPALLYFLATFMVIHFDSIKYGLKGLPKSELPPLGRTLKEGGQFLLPLAVLVYLLAIEGWSPQRSAIFALAILLVVAMFRKETRWTVNSLINSFDNGIRTLMSIVPVVGTLAIITGIMSLTGIGIVLSGGMVKAVGGNMILLLLMAALMSYIFGMGISFLASYIILAVMVVPPLVQLNIPPMAAHLFVMYYCALAFFTPPVALAVFVTSAIAEADFFKSGFAAMRLAVAAYIVPFFFVYSSALLLEGNPIRVFIAATTSIIGIVALAGAVSGYFRGNLNWLQRIILFGAGLLLVWPVWYISLIGIFILMMILVWVRQLRQKTDTIIGL